MAFLYEVNKSLNNQKDTIWNLCDSIDRLDNNQVYFFFDRFNHYLKEKTINETKENQNKVIDACDSIEKIITTLKYEKKQGNKETEKLAKKISEFDYQTISYIFDFLRMSYSNTFEKPSQLIHSIN